jgi:hypothetical protein
MRRMGGRVPASATITAGKAVKTTPTGLISRMTMLLRAGLTRYSSRTPTTRPPPITTATSSIRHEMR